VGMNYRAEDGVVKIPFRFNLEECRRASSLSELPPSIDSLEETKWWSGWKNTKSSSEYNVAYNISATAFSTKGAIASATHSLRVLPVTEAQPPLSPSDFAGEYFLAATSPSQLKPLRRTSGHRIEVAGQEPEPVTLDPTDEGVPGSTEIPFVAKLLPAKGSTLEAEYFPNRCEITARLVTRTFITPNGTTRAMPTVEDALEDGDSQVRTSRSNEQTFTVALPRWDQYASGTAEAFAITKFTFLFNIQSDTQQLSPTFFTPILSRRYAIECKLSFPGSPNSTLELSLPLQIVYEAPDVVISTINVIENKCT